MEYSLSNLKENFRTNYKYNNHIKMINALEKYVQANKVEMFYPKNLFLEDKQLEFYAFTNKNIIVITSTNDDTSLTVCLNVINRDNIKNIFIQENDDNKNEITLKIGVLDGNEIVFNNISDSNNHHSCGFKNHISNIAKYLLSD